MEDCAFQEALESARELRAAREGKAPIHRETLIEMPDVAALRARSGLSQNEFAAFMGISTRTLQDWEQGRRVPRGPARALLVVTERAPKTVFEAIGRARRVDQPGGPRRTVRTPTGGN